jgi:type II secretory pathway pseudopilin PulG
MSNRPQPRPPVPQVPDPQAESRDAGFSLVEAIVAILLISIAVIPLMLAGITSIRVSAQTNTIAEVETVLVNAADRVNRSSEGCDYDVFVQAAALENGWQSAQATAIYEYYEPGDDSPAVAGVWVMGACPGAQRPEGLVQRVTITVTSPDGKISRSLVVVKSDV